MARRKTCASISDDHQWIVHSTYHRLGRQVKFDLEVRKKKYDLRHPKVQQQLLTAWLRVATEDDAFTSIQKWGYPMGEKGREKFNLVLACECAKEIRWLNGFAVAAQQNDESLLNKYVMFSALPRKYSIKTYKIGRKIVKPPAPYSLLPSNQQTVYQFKFRDTQTLGQLSADGNSLEPLNLKSFSCNAINLITAARHMVMYVLNERLKGVQPVLEIVSSDREALYYSQTLTVRFPWQAIHMGLLNRLTGRDMLRKCRHPNCIEVFTGRSDKTYCSEKCREWCQNNLGIRQRDYTKRAVR